MKKKAIRQIRFRKDKASDLTVTLRGDPPAVIDALVNGLGLAALKRIQSELAARSSTK